jgi:hypothetical protein
MISPVSSHPAVPATQRAPQSKPQASPAPQQDTVQLSAKAHAHASGDVDHDGDSH